MTFTGLARRFRGAGGSPRVGPDTLIGATNDRTFSCPACARPLPVGQGRCAGCGSYLVSGVLVRTALLLVLVGAIVGMIGGAVVADVAMGSRLAAGDEARAILASRATPTAAAPVAAAPVAAAPADGHPPTSAMVAPPEGVTADLLQVAATNDRLARSAAGLAAALAIRGTSANDIAPILRKIAADLQFGRQSARDLAAWTPTATLAEEVTGLYETASSVADASLSVSFANDAAYVKAARRMSAALVPLASVAEATRAAAGRVGIVLPEPSPAP